MSPASEAAVWYVNDTSTAGDSFTTAVGADSRVTYIDPPGAVVIKITDALIDSHTQKEENGKLDKVRGVIRL